MIPIHPDIPVLTDLPVATMTYYCGIDIALVKGKRYHYCKKCEGWIEGDVITVPKDMGIIYYCRRLGHELKFVGYHV
jgi:hypothetical protein